MLDIAFIALLVGLAALAVGFAFACDWLSGPEEPGPPETGVKGAPPTASEAA